MARKAAPTNEVTEATQRWMKAHSREDLNDLVRELAATGEDTSDIAKAIDDLEDVEAEEEEWERTHVEQDED